MNLLKDTYVPQTPQQILITRAVCQKALNESSEYQQDLAKQYGIFPISGNKYRKLFLHRLANRLMSPGRNCGKRKLATRILQAALKKVAEFTSEQPVVVLLWALIRNTPVVSTRTTRQGSINVSVKVFLSQKVRTRLVLNKLVDNNKRTQCVATSLAREIVSAYKEEPKSRLTAQKQSMIKAAKLAAQ